MARINAIKGARLTFSQVAEPQNADSIPVAQPIVCFGGKQQTAALGREHEYNMMPESGPWFSLAFANGSNVAHCLYWCSRPSTVTGFSVPFPTYRPSVSPKRSSVRGCPPFDLALGNAWLLCRRDDFRRSGKRRHSMPLYPQGANALTYLPMAFRLHAK